MWDWWMLGNLVVMHHKSKGKAGQVVDHNRKLWRYNGWWVAGVGLGLAAAGVGACLIRGRLAAAGDLGWSEGSAALARRRSALGPGSSGVTIFCSGACGRATGSRPKAGRRRRPEPWPPARNTPPKGRDGVVQVSPADPVEASHQGAAITPYGTRPAGAKPPALLLWLFPSRSKIGARASAPLNP